MNKKTKDLDNYYKKFSQNLNEWLPDGILEVNLELLHDLGVLKYHSQQKTDFNLTRHFHVVESNERITLINELFIIWIVPEKINSVPTTYTLIALNRPEGPHLETAFATWGIYNSSRLVLRVLEKFLYDIQDTEDTLNSLKKP